MVCWANMRLVLVTFIRLYFIISSTLFIIYVYMFGLTGQAETRFPRYHGGLNLMSEASTTRQSFPFGANPKLSPYNARFNTSYADPDDYGNYNKIPDGDNDVLYDARDSKDEEQRFKETIDDAHGTPGAVNSSEKRRQFYLALTDRQNKLYNESVFKRIVTADIFYLSAIATTSQNQLNVTLNGWLGRKHRNQTLYCCFKGFKPSPAVVVKKSYWNVPDINMVAATQFTCNVDDMPDSANPVAKIGLNTKKHCANTQYIDIVYSKPKQSLKKNSFAVCAKIVYGDYDSEKLLEWFEINRAIGVDHVSMFTYNVTNKTEMVLKHYESTGFLTVNKFDFPLKMRYPRWMGQKYVMSYLDEQVAVFDCVVRLRNYDYIALIDVDEILVPRLSPFNYTKMMNRLRAKYPKAAGFAFQTELFILDWEPTFPDAQFMVGQYTKRTRAMWDRSKNVFMPGRVQLNTVWTHNFDSKPEYSKVRLWRGEAVLFHYRKCRPHWYQQNTCFQKRVRYNDQTMKHFVANIRNRLLLKQKQIFGKS